MKFTFNVNIEKKHILGLFLLFAIGMIGLVIAETTTWTDPVSGVWHDATNVKVRIGTNYYSLQAAIDGGLIGGATNLPAGSNVYSFSVPKASETDYVQNCTPRNVGSWFNDKFIEEGDATISVDVPGLQLVNNGKYSVTCNLDGRVQSKVITLKSDSNTGIFNSAIMQHQAFGAYAMPGDVTDPNYPKGKDVYLYSITLENNKLKFIVSRFCSGYSGSDRPTLFSSITPYYDCQHYKGTDWDGKIVYDQNTCPAYVVDGYPAKRVYEWAGLNDCTIQKIA